MQMLCHNPLSPAARQRRWLAAAQAAALSLALALGWVSAIAQTTGEALLRQDNLFKEVDKWMRQTQQLSPDQFDFVPLDSRVEVQSCDRPLVIDRPFANRETVRVRCVGTLSWKLYLRANIKVQAAKPSPPAAPAAVAATPPKTASTAATSRRKVVVGTQFLRAGTVLSAAMLEETEQAGAGMDNSFLGSLKDLENAEVVRDIPAGTALRSSDVRQALMVKQGQLVMLTISKGNSFAIVARVEALQDGRLGDQIRLKNPESGRLLSGVVTGPNAARGL